MEAMERDQTPDRLHDAEWPCAAGEPVAARERTTPSECQNESLVASLQGVHHHHQGQDCHAVSGQHDLNHRFAESPANNDQSASSVVRTVEGLSRAPDRPADGRAPLVEPGSFP